MNLLTTTKKTLLFQTTVSGNNLKVPNGCFILYGIQHVKLPSDFLRHFVQLGKHQLFSINQYDFFYITIIGGSDK